MLQSLAELRGNAKGDGFALGGAGGIASQCCGEVAVAAVLGIDFLENAVTEAIVLALRNMPVACFRQKKKSQAFA